jgi:DNA-directed RNA polymerase specialized sigma24 family protein
LLVAWLAASLAASLVTQALMPSLSPLLPVSFERMHRGGGSLPVASGPTQWRLDDEACSQLFARVKSTSDPAWRELVELLWPELTRLVRASRAMVALAQSDDHVHNAALLVLEKVSSDGFRAARLARAWTEAHPGKTLGDWLRIVTANAARDYARARTRKSGSGALAVDRRLVSSLASLLPDEDELGPASMLSQTSGYAARELARWADRELPPEQRAALACWLKGASFEEIATEIGAIDEAAAKRVVRAAVAALRRHANAAEASTGGVE